MMEPEGDSDFNDETHNLFESLEKSKNSREDIRDFVKTLKFAHEGLEIDKYPHHHENVGQTKLFKENRELFMDNYATRFEIPAAFVLNARTYKQEDKV